MLRGKLRGNNRGLTVTAFVAAVSTSLVLAGCSNSEGTEGDVTTLRYASIYSETSYEDTLTGWYLDEIEERTDGRVQFERFYDGSLVQTQNFPEALADGRIDAANLVATNYPSEFPIWQAGYIPIPDTNNVAHAMAQHELKTSNQAFADEIASNGLHFTHFMTTTPMGVATQEPLEGVADLSGSQVRANGIIAFLVDALGANPVSVTVEAAYDALERGTINAFAGTHIGYLSSSGLYEVAPWFNDLAVGAFSAQAFAFSKDAWDQLPKDVQQIITDISEDDWYEYQTEALIEAVQTGCDILIEGGGGANRLSETERAKARDMIGNSLWEIWREEATSSGASAEAVSSFEEGLKERSTALANEVEYDDGVEECAEQSQGE